jgi:Gas vesicle synthesis protein GvpL/GvpF
VLYLYAVTHASVDAPEAAGLEDTPLRSVADDVLAAIVSEHGPLDLDPTPSALWTHENVVETLMASATVLPMRFGTTLEDEAAVRSVLRNRRAELESGLERVAGAVELGLRVVLDGDDEDAHGPDDTAVAAPAAPGTAYLLDRLERTHRSQALVDRIHVPLAELARDSHRRLRATPRLLLSGSYLVDRETVETFRLRAADLDQEIAGASLICTGPWPPYSFAGARDEG